MTRDWESEWGITGIITGWHLLVGGDVCPSFLMQNCYDSQEHTGSLFFMNVKTGYHRGNIITSVTIKYFSKKIHTG